jgi:phenylpyruvate tautomerase PptA (4-oxalocrotonate tautomerase family)
MNTNIVSEQPSQTTIESGEVSRRTVLLAVSVGAAAVSGVQCLAAAAGSPSFGAPFVEMSFPVGVLSVEQKAALIKRVTDVVNAAMEFPSGPQRKLFVEILETPEGGFGVNGQVVVPRPK